MPISDRAKTDRIDITWLPLSNIDPVRRDWIDLQSRADHSYFQSWGWIGTWLRNMPPDFDARVLYAREAGRPVGMGLTVVGPRGRYAVLGGRAAHLSATGREAIDDRLYIAHNGFLVDKRCADTTVRALLSFLSNAIADRQMAEVHLPSVDAGHAAYLPGPGMRMVVYNRAPAHFVDLQEVRDAGGCLALASSNMRWRLRKTRRALEELGDVGIEIAPSAGEAADYLEQVIEIHQARWRSAGEPGAFGSEFACRFHRDLVATRFEKDEILLAKFSFDPRRPSFFYHFQYGGTVYSYLTAFPTFERNDISPGILAYSLLIERCAAAGYRRYDFLAGDQQYKRRLSTGSIQLAWCLLQPATAAFGAENLAREAFKRLRRTARRVPPFNRLAGE